ncbi:protein of unknown function [Paraburkholderia dioscoreae]|uniref:Uncharacterized protein n=1 Tax=Paraburkholderia dioscoreae TaxID=2604047 RepID=A0A5Q4ZNV7_9BURK|nr:protein of unknown function [Paraburkholderia dioscoreae]
MGVAFRPVVSHRYGHAMFTAWNSSAARFPLQAIRAATHFGDGQGRDELTAEAGHFQRLRDNFSLCQRSLNFLSANPDKAFQAFIPIHGTSYTRPPDEQDCLLAKLTEI